KRIVLPVETVNAAPVGGDPYIALLVLLYAGDKIVADTGRVAGIVFKIGEEVVLTVPQADPAKFRAYPYSAVFHFIESKHVIVHEAVGVQRVVGDGRKAVPLPVDDIDAAAL